MAEDNLRSKTGKKCNLNIMKDRPEHNQVMAYKSSIMSRFVQTMHRMVENSCRRACQLLYCSIDNLWCDSLGICPAQKQKQHTGDHHSAAAATVWSPPSTTFIVNISNSTMIGCVIGNETYPPCVAEKQPLMQQSHVTNRCSPAPASLTPSIQIENSNVSYVIIGDNNNMQVLIPPSNEECEEVCEDGK